ncbi:hypothetical protein SLEP1_g3506 [Rubroshorea leprosula]|uniref:Uncharacterized protein n=1 Tax=Rubroshorea leprosula TaxID=152421 RepID=A0AAV5HTW4_9ROSI|nr:hypothetical protein SLEP1_g3506 [Rubroshorea leprosula]
MLPPVGLAPWQCEVCVGKALGGLLDIHGGDRSCTGALCISISSKWINA